MIAEIEYQVLNARFPRTGRGPHYSNTFTRRRGLEPVGIARDVTSVKKQHNTITHLCTRLAGHRSATAKAIEDIRAGAVHYFARRGDSRAASAD